MTTRAPGKPQLQALPDGPTVREVSPAVEAVATSQITRTAPPHLGHLDRPNAEVSSASFANSSTVRAAALLPRYEPRGFLGLGGMGEVSLSRDTVFGRHVAVKRLRQELLHRPDASFRFLREASVQGQLEHPSIVPVYDLGLDATGHPYFTMRCISGDTLHGILDRLRSGDPRAATAYSQEVLLSAFVTVCRAVEYAHARGVLHRDLKPANIMVGTFGEVYVLDWGIAKILDESDAEVRPSSVRLGAGLQADTQVGTVMGTAGYMAPEQRHRDLGTVSTASDVYALGAILYEICTLHPLHDTEAGPIAATDTGPASGDPKPAAPLDDSGVAPELQRLWTEATRTSPGDRMASVSELREGIESYIAGERDSEARQHLATAHAQAAAMAALRSNDPNRTPEQRLQARSDALREASRALSLDPSHGAAMNTYLTIATGLPPTPPPEAVAAFRAKELAVGQELSRFVGPLLFFLPLLTQVHVSLAGAIDARFQYAILGSTLCFIVSHSWAGRQTGGVGWRVLLPFLSCIAVTASLGTITGFLGPIPVIVLFGVMCLYLRHLRHQPALANTVAVLGVLLFGLATALQTRWPELSRVDEMTPTSIRFAPWISSVPPVLPWILGASGTAAYAALAFYFLHASRVAARVALDNELKTWHLKHLVVDIDRRASASELPPKP